jgi:hypothetical protein
MVYRIESVFHVSIKTIQNSFSTTTDTLPVGSSHSSHSSLAMPYAYAKCKVGGNE